MFKLFFIHPLSKMQFPFAILTLAATAVLALPSNTIETRGVCTPPQYTCKGDNSGWLVCNVDGTWLVSA